MGGFDYSPGRPDDRVAELGMSKLVTAPTEAELVGHWSFDVSFVDSSGRNNHGTPGGNVIAGTDNGILGGAASFDGVGDFVSLPVDVSGSDWTVTAWAKAFNNGMFLASGGPQGWESLFIRRWDDISLHAAINCSSDLTQGFDLLLEAHIAATPPLNTYTDTVGDNPMRCYRVEVERGNGVHGPSYE